MIKISRYFENPFDDPEISAEEIRIFAEDHLGKITSQNNSGPLAGTLTAMVTATGAPSPAGPSRSAPRWEAR